VSVFETWRDGKPRDHLAAVDPGFLTMMALAMFGSAAVYQHFTIDQHFAITSILLAGSTASTSMIALSARLTVSHYNPGSAAVIADRKEVVSNMRGCPQFSSPDKGRRA
jgi:hypothetical protein